MKIERLLLHNFRNIEAADLKPGPNFNLIYGPNGSGKTSILEGISYLALARSFRGSNYQYLIRSRQPSFELFAKVAESRAGLTRDIGLSRGRRADLHVKIDGAPISKLSELVEHLCVQVIHPQGHELITGGPEERRRFMDWGVYYAVPKSRALYAQYRRVLKQRNMLLKKAAPAAEFQVWDELLCNLSDDISRLREEYLKALTEILYPIAGRFLSGFKLAFTLSRGYEQEGENGLSMRSALSANLERDRVLGYTSIGCHRADLKIKCNALSAGATLSRGQLKLLVCAMRMSQSLLLREQTKRNCIFLIDDLNSELDPRSQEILLTQLEQCRNQVFITNIARQLLFPDAGMQNFIALEDGRVVPS